MSYGGGIDSVDQATEIFRVGIEKLIIGTSFHRRPALVTEISQKFGSQSVMVSVDVGTDWLGKRKVFVNRASVNTGYTPVDYTLRAQESGAGEILLQSIEREGSYQGYDLDLIREISSSLRIPVVPLGGARSLDDFVKAIQTGASAVAAGNLFVYKGPHQAVLINYPDQNTLVNNLYSKI
jgi:cyclase